MGLIVEQPNLTVINPALESARRSTYPGMAHFAGSGPAGVTCRQCRDWTGCGQESGYYAKKGKHGGVLKPRPCGTYRALMGGEIGPAVPHDARACKYFIETPTPPSLTERS